MDIILTLKIVAAWLALVTIYLCLLSYTNGWYKSKATDILFPFGKFIFNIKHQIQIDTRDMRCYVCVTYRNLFGKHFLLFESIDAGKNVFKLTGLDFFKSGHCVYQCEQDQQLVYGSDLAHILPNWDATFNRQVEEELRWAEEIARDNQIELREAIANANPVPLMELNRVLLPSLLTNVRLYGGLDDFICPGNAHGMRNMYHIDFYDGVRDDRDVEESGGFIWLKKIFWIRDKLHIQFIERDGRTIECTSDKIRKIPVAPNMSSMHVHYFEPGALQDIAQSQEVELVDDVVKYHRTVETLCAYVENDSHTYESSFDEMAFDQIIAKVKVQMIVNNPSAALLSQ